MSSLFAMRALLFAGECLIGSVAILGLAWGLSLCVKRASLRHLVWLTAFAALTALPVAALIVPPQFVLQRAAQVEEKLATEPEVATPAPEESIVQAPSVAPEPAPVTVEKSAFDLDDAALLVFTLWMAGVLWAVARLVLGAFGLAALRSASRPHTLAPENLPCTGSRRECELRLSNSGHGPMTFGLFKPVVLLPKDSLGWPGARLRAVLLHELAHVRRRDSLTQSLALIAAALYWPNPLVWIAARALRREAEIAADDAVIVAGIRPSAYAGELVQLASEFRGRLATSGVSMAGSALEARVKSALAPDQMRTGVTIMDVLKIACLGIAATAALAFLRPDVVDAQDAPPPPPAVVSASDLPPPPPPPPPQAAEIPAVPAVPSVAAVPPPPPVPPAPSVEVRVIRHGNDVRVERTVHVVHADKAEIARAQEEAHRAMAELDRVRPEIDKALDEAKIDAKVAKALKDVEPRVRAEIDRAMAQAKPEIRRALAEAHISEKVAKALAEARPKIDAAIAEATKANRRVRIEMHEDGDVHAKVDEDKSDDADDESETDEQK